MTTGDKKRRMDRSRKDACYYYVNKHVSSSGHVINALDPLDPVPESELRERLREHFDVRAVAPPRSESVPVEDLEVPEAQETEEPADDDLYIVPAEALAPEDPEPAPRLVPKPIPKLKPPESWKFPRLPSAVKRGELKLNPGSLVMRISSKRDGAIDNPTREDCVGPYIVERYEGKNPRGVILHDPTHGTHVRYNVRETFYYDGERPPGFPPAKPARR
jgi:hypothetical protein